MPKYKWHKHKAKSLHYNRGHINGYINPAFTLNGDFIDTGEIRQAGTPLVVGHSSTGSSGSIETIAGSPLPDVHWGGNYASGTSGDITIRTGSARGAEILYLSADGGIEQRNDPPRAPSGTIYHDVDDGTMRVINGDGDSVIIAPEESEIGSQLAQLYQSDRVR